MPLQVGDSVRVLAPFNEAFPGTYVIESVNPLSGAFQIAGGCDFDAVYLELASP